MTPAQKISKLEGLLARVRQNATRPRSLAVVGRAGPEPVLAEVEPEEEPTPLAPEAEALPLGLVAASAPAEDEEEISVDVELLDEDIVDITDLGPEEAAAADALASSEVDLEVEPPSSSRRSKLAAATMDEALATAAAEEAPLKTPPPESGRQVAPLVPAGQLQQPPIPPDLAALTTPVAAFPAVEQPGGGQPPAPAAEAPPAEPLWPKPAPAPREELEAALAEGIKATPPVVARAPAVPAAPTPALAQEPVPPPPAVAKAEPPAEPAPPPELEPEVVTRAAPPPLAQFIGEAQKFKPESFVELLDASLGL